jgi:hypothetical protein
MLAAFVASMVAGMMKFYQLSYNIATPWAALRRIHASGNCGGLSVKK